jgi:hypothetical protein
MVPKMILVQFAHVGWPVSSDKPSNPQADWRPFSFSVVSCWKWAWISFHVFSPTAVVVVIHDVAAED